MEVLRDVDRKYGERIEIVLFGEETLHPEFMTLPQDFKWCNLGKQTPEQLAVVMNESDIFVDFSEYQAMGLTAMEAMACGVAVIVPEQGGANSFALHESNALLVDSRNTDACVSTLSRLIEDDNLRVNIQRQAIQDVSQFSPEVASYNLMQALFPLPSIREGA
jgi:glycosyltransferase involved in cell wall biosynthesis